MPCSQTDRWVLCAGYLMPMPWHSRSNCPQAGFGQTHQPIEGKAHHPDGQDREEDVRVDQAVVLLPEKTADARRAGEHLARDDRQPRDAETETVAREQMRQRRG